MSVLFQRLHDGAKQGVVVALGQRMAMDDLNQHDANNAGAAALVPVGWTRASSCG
jgi:hypothetical protein